MPVLSGSTLRAGAIVAGLSLFLGLLAEVSQSFACYAVVVGRDASADGSVLLGHAEQNQGQLLLNFRRVPPQHFPNDAAVHLERGGKLAQVPQTAGFLWSEIPGRQFSDNFLNEWGVAVVSDFCPSREDDYELLVRRGEIRDGGIGYMLRRLVAERAQNARQGVELAGRLIERFGYADSGRTYVIADPREAWLLAVVRGRHWVACRVPDDQVVLLPNVYVTAEVNLGDSKNFLGSEDLVEYAIKRGWFRPQGSRAFRFDVAYGAHGGAADERRWKGEQLLTGRQIPWPPASVPLGMKPPRKLSVSAVADILRGVIPADRSGGSTTQEGAVFALRADLPCEIGCVYWRTSGEPSMNVLLPWYLGIQQTPPGYYQAGDLDRQLTLAYHLQPPGKPEADWPRAWGIFQELQASVQQDLAGRLPIVRSAWVALEQRAVGEQRGVQTRAVELWKSDPAAARSYLTQYCAHLAEEAGREAERLLQQWRAR